MSIDRVLITSIEYGKITFVPTLLNDLPSSLSSNWGDFKNNLQIFSAAGPYGSIVHHVIREGNYSLWHSRFMVSQDIAMKIKSEKPLVVLCFLLKNNITHRFDGLSENTLLENQYNMIYHPNLKGEFKLLENNEYVFFGIQFSLRYLDQWKHLFPSLLAFLDTINSNRPAMIIHSHSVITPEMKITIQEILKCIFNEPSRKIRIEGKTLELLESSLLQIENQIYKIPNLNLSSSDIEKIIEAREYILQHLENPGTLRNLAHTVGTNLFKLKKGFKWIYGTTVFEFLRNERMQKAKILLLETNIPIANIATIIGFKNHSNFTSFFKKRTGYSPSELRH